MSHATARPALLVTALAVALAVACAEKADPGSPGAGGAQGATGGADGATGGGAGTLSSSGGTPPTAGTSSGGSGTGGSGTGGNGTGGNATGGNATGGSGGSAGSATAGSATAGNGTGGSAGSTGGAGGTPATGGSAGTGASGGSAGGPTGEPAVHFVGRVDAADPNAAKFAWSGTGAVARFDGTSVGVRLSGGQEYTVVLDGQVQPQKLVPSSGTSAIATGLTAGPHTVEIYRRTEGSQGVSTFMGFDFGSGTLLAPPAVTRRLEFIGDFITCGYGNEGPDMNCGFTPQTENHYLAYPALTARALGAEVSTVAWSGKGVTCNYGDDASSCMDPLPTYYERILPDQASPAWDFSKFQADAVVVNLGTNDLSTATDPSQQEFEAAYRALLEKVRAKYPNAFILCTNGPMLSGTELTTVRGYLTNVVTALGDAKISTFSIDAQDGSDGYGCDWHPSLARHEKVAAVVTAAIKAKLGW